MQYSPAGNPSKCDEGRAALQGAGFPASKRRLAAPYASRTAVYAITRSFAILFAACGGGHAKGK